MKLEKYDSGYKPDIHEFDEIDMRRVIVLSDAPKKSKSKKYQTGI